MATESPIRIMESDKSKKWGTTVDPALFSSPFSTSAGGHEDFTKILKESAVFDEQNRMGPSRSGSAPPTVEGSIAVFRTFMDQKNSNLTNTRSEFLDCESEEQMRSDPGYIAYYYANVNLNPRLPPPLISRESRHLMRLIRGVGTKKVPVTEGFLATHVEEPEEDMSIQQSFEDQKQDFVSGLREGDFVRASPASTTVTEGGSEYLTNTMSATDKKSVHGLSLDFTDDRRDVSYAKCSTSASVSCPAASPSPRKYDSEENVSTRSNLGSDTSSEKSRIKSLELSGDLMTEDNQRRLKNLNLCDNNRLPNHFRQHTGYQTLGSQSDVFPQGPYALQYGMEKLMTTHPKLPMMQPCMHNPGTVPPFYATTASYVHASNHQYPSLQLPGFPIPQVTHSGLHPAHFGGHLPTNAYPVHVDPYPTMGFLRPPMETLASEIRPFTSQILYPSKHHFQQEMMLRHFTAPVQGQHFQPSFQEAQRAVIQHNLASNNKDTGASSSTGYTELSYPGIGNLNISSPTHGSHIGINYFGFPPTIAMSHFPAPSTVPGSPLSGINHPGFLTEFTSSQHSPKDPAAFSGWKGQRASESSDDCKKNSFLELLRSCSSKNLELSDISGQIVEFSTDQHGSRFIQQKLEYCSTEEKESVFKEVLPHASKLITDVFGNYVIQKFFEYGTHEHRKQLGEELTGQILTLSLQMYGCRVIQKALEVIELEQKVKLVQELDGHVMRCVHDQNGNHVIQKCIETVPAEMIKFIISSFQNQVAALSSHPYGCRVIQRVLEHCSDEQISRCIVDEILESSCTLAQDPYGNYVTQHILETGKPQERSQIIRKLAGKFIQMSQHKFASNVVEKCLKYGNASERDLIIEEFIAKSDNDDALLLMMKDQFANYVIQKIFDIGTAKQKETLLNCIQSHLPVLKKFSYAKQIVARYEQLTEGSSQEQK